MTVYFRTTIREIGPEVADLIEEGVLILFAEGAPPELAEVSVLHAVDERPSADAPPVGAQVAVGAVQAELTAIGSLAWAKIAEMGHVVITFDGAQASKRPGELSASLVAPDSLLDALRPGATILISA